MSENAAQTSQGGGMKNVLEFEKPIAKMEEEIRRLEGTQAQSGLSLIHI